MAKKVGRNEPCPCGSGKKYKKCCLPREREQQRLATTGESARARERESRARERERERERTRARAETRARERSRVAGLSTEALVEGLERLGLRHPEDEVRAAPSRTARATELAEEWAKRTLSSSHEEELFLLFAAQELWRRLHPDQPSVEMIDEWLRAGYAALEKGDMQGASEHWGRCWSAVSARLTPEMTTCDAAADVFPTTEFLFNWVHDYAMALYNGSLDDTALAATGEEFCGQVLEQFSEEHALHIGMTGDRAELLGRLGRTDEAEALLRQLMTDQPEDPSGYVLLAQQYRDAGDTGAAIELLQAACTLPRAADWDVEARLEGLEESVAREGG
jgi:tetratricopeptide (TPR) repeat protein